MSSDGSAAKVHLVDASGRDLASSPGDVTGRLQAGGFFWIDLESPGDEALVTFCESLQLSSDLSATLKQANARSSFTLAADSAHAVLAAAVDTEATVWLDAAYVTAVLTERFLFTTHDAPCPPLQHARQKFLELDGDDSRSDQTRVLFMVLDALLDSFIPQLLALDDRLGDIQLGMLTGASAKVHDELVQILGILTDGIQELGWYAHDLEEVAEMVDRLPGMQPRARAHCTRHRQHVTRIRENGRDIREEAKDALQQYSGAVAGRQAQVLSSLTIVATVFLPLSFLTGYFGMNFRTLTADVQIKLWQFLLLGMLLPIASAALSLLLIQRLERRFGIAGMGRRPS